MNKLDLRQLLEWESELYYQKTRAKWLQDGDYNSKFFLAVIRERRRRNKIALRGPDGATVSHPQEIYQLAASYFPQLFSASPYSIHEELFEHLPVKVTSSMN